MNAHQRTRRNQRIRQFLLRAVVWIILAGFLLPIVGVALINIAR